MRNNPKSFRQLEKPNQSENLRSIGLLQSLPYNNVKANTLGPIKSLLTQCNTTFLSE